MEVDYQEKLIAHYRAKLQIEAVLGFANRPKKTPKPPRRRR